MRTLDPVRDRIVIQVFGGHSSAVLFDARTRVFVNGQAASLHDLTAGQQVYVETVLDKADVFARSIHISNRTPDAQQTTGQILSYDAGRGELVLRDGFFPKPVKMRISGATPVLQGDHAVNAAALQAGTLVTVKFAILAGQTPVAQQVSILAQPGTSFVFPGQVTFLDLHKRVLVLSDPRDNKSYEVYCDPAIVAIPEDLHEGANVTVATNFDGTHYTATSITLNPDPTH